MTEDIVTRVFRHHPLTAEQLGPLLKSSAPDLLKIFLETGDRVFYLRRSSVNDCITVVFLMDNEVTYLRLKVIFVGGVDGIERSVHFSDDAKIVFRSLNHVLVTFRKDGYTLFSDFKTRQMKIIEDELGREFGKIHLTWLDVITLNRWKLRAGTRIIVRSSRFNIDIWRVYLDDDGDTRFSIDTKYTVEFDVDAFPILIKCNYGSDKNISPMSTKEHYHTLFNDVQNSSRTIIIGLFSKLSLPIYHGDVTHYVSKPIECSL